MFFCWIVLGDDEGLEFVVQQELNYVGDWIQVIGIEFVDLGWDVEEWDFLYFIGDWGVLNEFYYFIFLDYFVGCDCDIFVDYKWVFIDVVWYVVIFGYVLIGVLQVFDQ